MIKQELMSQCRMNNIFFLILGIVNIFVISSNFDSVKSYSTDNNVTTLKKVTENLKYYIRFHKP